jgi:hypothetical protein
MDDSMNVNTSPLYAFGVSPAISKGSSLDAPEELTAEEVL